MTCTEFKIIANFGNKIGTKAVINIDAERENEAKLLFKKLSESRNIFNMLCSLGIKYSQYPLETLTLIKSYYNYKDIVRKEIIEQVSNK